MDTNQSGGTVICGPDGDGGGRLFCQHCSLYPSVGEVAADAAISAVRRQHKDFHRVRTPKIR